MFVSVTVLAFVVGRLADSWFPEDPHGVGGGLLAMVGLVISILISMVSGFFTWSKFGRGPKLD
jgi:hypothetical protein